MQLIHYRREDGSIEAVYESGLREILELNRREDDVIASVFVDDPVLAAHHERYQIVDGWVQLKSQLLLSAEPPALPADGISTSTITVTPFVPCRLDVNGRQVILTQDDPMLVLTTDQVQPITITLVAMPGYWAQPLTVEAV
jgi:hypothetical protein